MAKIIKNTAKGKAKAVIKKGTLKAMEKVKIKRVKRNTKKATTSEKILAGIGVGSTLLGGASAVMSKPEPTQFVRNTDSQKTGTSKVKSALKRIFGIEEAKAVSAVDLAKAAKDEAQRNFEAVHAWYQTEWDNLDASSDPWYEEMSTEEPTKTNRQVRQDVLSQARTEAMNTLAQAEAAYNDAVTAANNTPPPVIVTPPVTVVTTPPVTNPPVTSTVKQVPVNANGQINAGWQTYGTAYYSSTLGLYSNADGSIQSTTSNGFMAEVAKHPELFHSQYFNGQPPTGTRDIFIEGVKVVDFWTPGNPSQPANSMYFMPRAEAEKIASYIGGTVEEMQLSGPYRYIGPDGQPIPTYGIRVGKYLGSAGLIYNTYLNYAGNWQLADQMIHDEIVAENSHSGSTSTSTGSGTSTGGTSTGSGTTQTTVRNVTLPNAQANKSYSQQLTTSSGASTGYLWTAIAGTVPLGLGVDGSTGKLTGTPAKAGTYEFTLTAQKLGTSQIESIKYKIVVEGAVQTNTPASRTPVTTTPASETATPAKTLNAGVFLGKNPLGSSSADQVFLSNISVYNENDENVESKIKSGYTVEIGGQGVEVYDKFFAVVGNKEYEIKKFTKGQYSTKLTIPNLPEANGAEVKIKLVSSNYSQFSGILGETYSYQASDSEDVVAASSGAEDEETDSEDSTEDEETDVDDGAEGEEEEVEAGEDAGDVGGAEDEETDVDDGAEGEEEEVEAGEDAGDVGGAEDEETDVDDEEAGEDTDIDAEETPLATTNNTASQNSSSYTVKKGDTLWSIAVKQYGDGKKFRTILEANTKQLKSPQDLQPGMILVIPKIEL